MLLMFDSLAEKGSPFMARRALNLLLQFLQSSPLIKTSLLEAKHAEVAKQTQSNT